MIIGFGSCYFKTYFKPNLILLFGCLRSKAAVLFVLLLVRTYSDCFLFSFRIINIFYIFFFTLFLAARPKMSLFYLQKSSSLFLVVKLNSLNSSSSFLVACLYFQH